MQTKTAICLLSVAIIFMTSCSANKESASLKMMSANHIIREIDDNRFEFDKLETKFDVKVKGNNKLGLKGQLRMQNDSLIWISLSLKVGIEMGRVMITEDSLKFINRSQRTYISESLDIAKDIIPLENSIKFVQDILVGNNNSLAHDNKFKVSTENNKYKLESDKREFPTKDIWITPKTFKISRYEMKFPDNRNSINIQYDEFQKINGKLLPTRIILELNSGNEISLEINYSDVKTEENLDFPFNISKKYERIKL